MTIQTYEQKIKELETIYNQAQEKARFERLSTAVMKTAGYGSLVYGLINGETIALNIGTALLIGSEVVGATASADREIQLLRKLHSTERRVISLEERIKQGGQQ